MNNNIDWEDIIETIKDEKCVLFIDSRVYSGQDSNVVDLINQKVFNNPKLGYVKSHYPDGFIFLNREDYRNRLIRKMKATYDNFYGDVYPLLDKISQIPFHLIISLSPDNLLSRIMSENGFPHNNAAYSKETSSQYFEATSKMPLIYNMLGSFTDFGSVVLTHDDLFSFLERNFTGKSISLKMKKQIFDADRYLFLGFPFERWYIQLLMRMIGLHDSDRIHKVATSSASVSFSKDLYKNQFEIEFVNENPIDFLELLHQKCSELNFFRAKKKSEKDILLNISSFKEDIKLKLSKGDTDLALEKLKELVDNFFNQNIDIQNQVIVLMNQYQTYKKEERLDLGASKTTPNKVVYGILGILSLLDKPNLN